MALSPHSRNLLWSFFLAGVFFPARPLFAQQPNDSLRTPADSIQIAGDLDAPVDYSSADSMNYDLRNEVVTLFGAAHVVYKDITLDAWKIIFDWRNNQVIAFVNPDTTAKDRGMPVFTQGADQSFRAQEIHYNFKTKKGKISQVITQQDEGYIHAEVVKKDSGDSYFGKNAIYTTCELDHPHFYIASSKMKVVPDKVLVSGPAVLKIADIPTPLALPFGIFPIKKGQTSGIIIPAYGESPTLGFYLQNGGYYFALNKHADLQLTGDIYSRGSFRGQLQSNYVWKYKFSGNLGMQYSNTRIGDKLIEGYSNPTDFRINWNFRQDGKARPNTRFSASVFAGTSGFAQHNIVSEQDYLTNTYNSSINFYHQFGKSPLSFNTTLSHEQNTQTHLINFQLPSASLTMARIYPLRWRKLSGSPRWYEKIGLSSTLETTNNFSTTDSTIKEDFIPQNFRNGAQISVPVTTSFSLFKHFTISPSANFRGIGFTKTIRERWDDDSGKIYLDTIQGMDAAYEFNTGISMSTRLFGMLRFRHGKIKAIRHVLSPTVSANYKPDFSNQSWGFYKAVQYDSLGHTQQYSIFDNQIYSAPGSGRVGGIGLSLGNNLEMKVYSKKDTVNHTKKIKLLDNLNLSSFYNFAADSLNLSPVAMSGNTTLFEKVGLNFAASWDPYALNSTGKKINTFQLDQENKLARLTSASVGMNTRLSPKTKKTKTKPSLNQHELNEVTSHPDQYIDFNIPWNLSLGYNLRLTNTRLTSGVDTSAVTQTANVSGDLKLTENWKVSFSTSYDFTGKKFSYTSIDIYRDLHCWELTFHWVPYGPQRNYSVVLNVKSPVLQELRLTKKKYFYDY